MNENIVEQYTWNILKKQLQKHKVLNAILYEIIDNIKLQLNSIIYNWNNLEFRNCLLILGSEEGHFYEPHNELIANMVVVAIRNSLLEGIASDEYKKYGNNQMFKDSEIKEITSEAIKYFEQYNLSEYSEKITLEYDFYGEISSKYPVAIHALKELSKCTPEDREHPYHKLNYDKPYELEELEDNNTNINDFKSKNIESGINPNLNNSTCTLLKGIKTKESNFIVVDSFKMLTRNFEKLLRILEFILTHDGAFITCNYLITPDYVSRRKDILKAGHNLEDFNKKLNKIPEVTEHHNILKNVEIILK